MSGRAHCPECGGAMTEGTVADYRRGAVHPSEWVEGRVESSFWTGKLRNEERYEITAYRCEKCGFVTFYADKPATSPRTSY